MSAFYGFIWVCICIAFAIGLWVFNVTVLDNALPPVLDAITAAFTHPIMNNTDNVVFFMRVVDYSPLYIIFLGLLGWIIECTIFGTSIEES